jgi:hypothetical protein
MKFAYLVIGLIASLVPILLVGSSAEKDPSIDLNYYEFVRYTSMFFMIFNLIYLSLMEYLDVKNYFLIGAIAALLISSYGRFVQEIPTKIFKLENPNMFHVYALLIWTPYYGIIGQSLEYMC